jgi:hypothetical protein
MLLQLGTSIHYGFGEMFYISLKTRKRNKKYAIICEYKLQSSSSIYLIFTCYAVIYYKTQFRLEDKRFSNFYFRIDEPQLSIDRDEYKISVKIELE